MTQYKPMRNSNSTFTFSFLEFGNILRDWCSDKINVNMDELMDSLMFASIVIKKLIPQIEQSIFIFNEIKLQLLIYICEVYYKLAYLTFTILYIAKYQADCNTDLMLRRTILIIRQSIRLTIKYYILFISGKQGPCYSKENIYDSAKERLECFLDMQRTLRQSESFPNLIAGLQFTRI